MSFDGSYLIVMVTGCANVIPLGPKSNAVPGISRSFGGGLAAGDTVMFRVAVSAPGGTVIVTVELCALKDAPELETTAPSNTVTSVEAECPSMVAVTVAVPSATPVTTPAATVTFVGSELAHEISRFVRLLPLASFGIAVMMSVPPTTRPTEPAGEKTTVATGAGGAVESPQPNAMNAAAARIKKRVRLTGRKSANS